MKKVLLFFSCILLTLLISGVSKLLTATEIKTWYSALHKPAFHAPESNTI